MNAYIFLATPYLIIALVVSAAFLYLFFRRDLAMTKEWREFEGRIDAFNEFNAVGPSGAVLA